MKDTQSIYIKLQEHLDNQPVGFPATASRAELKVLEHIFSPLEAEIACCLSYKPEPLHAIFNRVHHLVDTPDLLADLLDQIQKKGGIESKLMAGQRHYCNAPLVVGMYEMQLERLTPEFIEDFDAYTGHRKFGIEFLSSELPQMRTIPIQKSIRPQHHIHTYDEVSHLLKQAEPPFVVFECICRKKKAMAGTPCTMTDRKETCMAAGGVGQSALLADLGREISRDEAGSILEQNQKQGLVLQPSNSEKIEFICSCCGCCCGMLGLHKMLPKPLEFWASNFQAAVDETACDGCGICVRRCQVTAVHLKAKKHPADVDLSRCLGCGVCVPACPRKAISLVKKPTETRPPETREALFDIIMAHKKGTLGKIKLTGKLLIDAVATGHTHVLK